VSDQPTIPTQTTTQGQPGQQQIQVPINDSEMDNLYVNFFRMTPTTEEVLVDVGFLSRVLGPTGPEPLKLTHRLILNYVKAKELAELLRMVVARHEQLYGVIEIDPQRRMRFNPQQQQRPIG
jgi:Protein of unknown function (DUF3467)